MASLKALRARINSVKSTRKITSAMKMVAASKLKRAQTQAEAARPYAERMQRMLADPGDAAPPGRRRRRRCWWGPGRDQVHLLVVVTADRGLAGAFNTNVGRAARTRDPAAGGGRARPSSVITVGRKGRDYLRREVCQPAGGRVQLRRQEAGRVLRRGRGCGAYYGHAGRGRVRRLHHRVQPLPVRHQPNPDRGAADPAVRAGEQTLRPEQLVRRRSTSSSRTRRPSSPPCCRATWQSNCSAP